jgi:uncharacterized protein (TIGR00730 family)
VKRVCVFCGSSPGARSAYAEAATAFGSALAARRTGLVYGGGNVGLMDDVANAVLDAGGHVIGVIPEALVAREVAHLGISELRVVGSMHERKAVMADLAVAVVALPGGFGTIEELFEVLTWTQLGLHEKPCGLLDVAGYYRPLIAFLDHALAERFVTPEHRSMLLVADDANELLDRLDRWRPPSVDKWIDRESS